MATVFPSPPFINLPGIYNFRSIGNLPSDPSALSLTIPIRPHYIFRSAQPYSATPIAISHMKALNITTIFDLRSPVEIEETAAQTPLRELEGMRRVSIPIFDDRGFKEQKVAGKLEAYFENDTAAFMTTYTRILASGAPSFRQIFLHLRDKPSEACIIHCAIGKDRTGVAIALILALAGVDAATIADEFALTETGLQPMKPQILRWLATLSKLEWDEGKVDAIIGAKATTMLETLDVLDTQYGGAEAYVRNQCGFDSSEIEQIRNNLRGPEQEIQTASSPSNFVNIQWKPLGEAHEDGMVEESGSSVVQNT